VNKIANRNRFRMDMIGILPTVTNCASYSLQLSQIHSRGSHRSWNDQGNPTGVSENLHSLG
jgi:hypothetical protein